MQELAHVCLGHGRVCLESRKQKKMSANKKKRSFRLDASLDARGSHRRHTQHMASRTFVGTQCHTLAALPFAPAAGGGDAEGGVVAHRLLAAGGWNQDAEVGGW